MSEKRPSAWVVSTTNSAVACWRALYPTMLWAVGGPYIQQCCGPVGGPYIQQCCVLLAGPISNNAVGCWRALYPTMLWACWRALYPTMLGPVGGPYIQQCCGLLAGPISNNAVGLLAGPISNNAVGLLAGPIPTIGRKCSMVKLLRMGCEQDKRRCGLVRPHVARFTTAHRNMLDPGRHGGTAMWHTAAWHARRCQSCNGKCCAWAAPHRTVNPA